MFPFHWLTTFQQQYRSRFRQSARIRQHRNRHACSPCIARATPRHAVELLEDRMLLTAFTVVNTNDSGEGSLRDAIEQANATAGADTISFDASLAGQTILLTDEIDITDDLTIIGLGADQLTISGNHNSRIFNVDDGDAETTIEVSLSGLTLTEGYAENGGAILNNEILSITDSTISESESILNGGGVYHAAGLLTITDTLFAGNRAHRDGGGLYNSTQDLEISGSTFLRNVAERNGGGVYTLQGVSRYRISEPVNTLDIPFHLLLWNQEYEYEYNSISIIGTSFIENSAKRGGGFYSGSTSGPLIFNPLLGCDVVSLEMSGGLQSESTDRSKSEFTIVDSVFTDNSAIYGGAIFNSAGLIEMERISILSNSATYEGGGIYNRGQFVIEASTISENTATQGGGINNSSGNMTIRNSTLSNNFATNYGGAIDNTRNLSIINSTLSGNRAGISGGGIFQWSGFQVLLSPDVGMASSNIQSEVLSSTSPVGDTQNSLAMTTWTVSVSDYAGPINDFFFDPSSTLNIINSTITGNSAGHSGGGIASHPGYNYYTTTTITNSIVAGNTAESSAQVEGSFVFNSNIIRDSIEGLLDPVLRDNGGPTKTHALLSGSAAINAGDNEAALLAGLTSDQRGSEYERFVAGTVDIGAFESDSEYVLVEIPLIVDSLSDEDDGDYSSGQLSLREAVRLANEMPGADNITFAEYLSGQTIIINSELIIFDDLTINGLGADQLTISGNHNSRIFNIDDGDKNTTITVEISGLTLTNGFAELGAAILNYETLSLSDSTVSENTATSLGGGIYHAGAVLTITDTLFAENTAAYGGGIYNATQDLIISGSTFFRNSASEQGGGIYTLQGVSRYAVHLPQLVLYNSYICSLDYQYNLVTITDTTFSENSATQGGALYSAYTSRPFYSSSWYSNPSVLNGAYQSVNTARSHPEFTIANSTFTGNTAVDGGGIYNDQGNITLSTSSISENVAQQSGGGILSGSGLTIENSSITNNKAGYGAGIYIRGNLNINGSTLAHNSASYYGGGIYFYYSSGVLLNSTLSANHAGVEGGGIFFIGLLPFRISYPPDPVADPGLIDIASDTTLSQTSLTGDSLPLTPTPVNLIDPIYELTYCSSQYVEVQWISLVYDLSMTNCTITGNSAGQSGGGIASNGSHEYSIVTFNNSIIAGNVATSSAQIKGDYSGGFNIIQDSIEGLLDPVLRDNGGPTKTHALLAGSAAIDAGNNQAATEAGLATDQRGEGSQRIKEGTVDIGAFEVQAPFTQVDFRFVSSKTNRLNNGEQEQLPKNRIWLDEAGNYWVEIWLHTPASTTPGIQSASFNLNYNTAAATAVSIEYGPAFTENQSGTINQNMGTIENLAAETTRDDVGDDQYTLFARIQFHANITDSADGERGRHTPTSVINPDITVNQLDIRLTGGAASEEIVNQSPGDPVWFNPEPASEIAAFNNQVQGNLQFDYYVQPDNLFAAANLPMNHDFAYDSQLALIDLPGSPVVNQADNETDILNELDSLVGSRDETEDDLLKKTTSADRDLSAEEDVDQFFSDLTEETELLVF